MSDKTVARRARAEVNFGGINITESIQPYLISLTYTDNEEDDCDDLQILLADREGIWLTEWLNDIINAAATTNTVNQAVVPVATSVGWKIGDAVIVNGRPQYSSYGNGQQGYIVDKHKGKITHLNTNSGVLYPIHVDQLGWFAESQVSREGATSQKALEPSITGLKIDAMIIAENWKTTGKDKVLDCGQFELDSVDASGPPATINIKSTALPYSSQIRQTEKSRSWESSKLSSIANTIATENGMTCLYESGYDPIYKRMEQVKTSDIRFLSKLCHDAGISLKTTNNILVLFEQTEYEAKSPILTITHGDGSYLKWKLQTGEADTKYASCRVSYTDPASGLSIEATVYVEDYDAKRENNQQLEITAKVASKTEAAILAEKSLRLHNKHQKTASFTFPGNPNFMAGLRVDLDGWGLWNGRYIIKRAIHSIGNSGYTTQVYLRRTLFTRRSGISAQTGWSVGDEVIVTGSPQYSSYGNGRAGEYVVNRKGKITFLNLRSGIPYPIHVDTLGWFAENQVIKADVTEKKEGY